MPLPASPTSMTTRAGPRSRRSGETLGLSLGRLSGTSCTTAKRVSKPTDCGIFRVYHHSAGSTPSSRQVEPLDLAQHAETWGSRRCWLAEQFGTLASLHPGRIAQFLDQEEGLARPPRPRCFLRPPTIAEVSALQRLGAIPTLVRSRVRPISATMPSRMAGRDRGAFVAGARLAATWYRPGIGDTVYDPRGTGEIPPLHPPDRTRTAHEQAR